MSAEDGFGVVTIVGVGLIGGSLGMALRRSGLASRVIGLGRNTQRLAQAVELGAIDEFVTNIEQGCRNADVVVLCTPVSRIIDDLPAVLAASGQNAVITDVGSVKSAIVDAAAGDPRFIGSHPMAGSEATGVEAARVNLFNNATWVVTPVATTAPQALSTAQSLGNAVGACVHTTTPDAHDAAVALVSHLPHVIATSLMLCAKREASTSPALPFMSAGSFADATRVAASSPEIWRDVCLTNRDAILAALDGLASQLGNAREVIASADSDALYAMFDEGAKAKADWRKR